MTEIQPTRAGLLRWVLLLAVMELAAMAMYVPSWGDLTGESVLFPEKLLKPTLIGGEWEKIFLDRHRAGRCAVGLASYGVMVGCWLVALYWLVRSGGRMHRRTLMVVLGGAAAVAITLWGLPPTFSDDSYRYRWEGMSTISGFNPYEYAPNAAGRLAARHPELFWSTDFRGRPTIYPPFGVFLFSVNGLFGNTMLGWRVMLLAAQVLLAAGCLEMLKRRGAQPGWLIAVALCPLLIIETHLDGHLEIIPVALTVAGIVMLDRRQWWQLSMLLSLAVMMKYLWPALAAFLLLGRLARQKRLLRGAGVFVLTAAVCWMPMMLLSLVGANMTDLEEGWPGWVPSPVKLMIKAPRQFLESPNFNAVFYRVLSEQFHPELQLPKMIVLTLLLGGVALLIWRRRWWMDLEDITLVLGLALIISPVSYPWYFIWLVPGLLMLRRGPTAIAAAPLPEGRALSRPLADATAGVPPNGPVGFPVWIVFYLAVIPAIQEYLAGFFRTTHARPFVALPWLMVAAVAPLLAAAWTARLLRPRFCGPRSG